MSLCSMHGDTHHKLDKTIKNSGSLDEIHKTNR